MISNELKKLGSQRMLENAEEIDKLNININNLSKRIGEFKKVMDAMIAKRVLLQTENSAIEYDFKQGVGNVIRK